MTLLHDLKECLRTDHRHSAEVERLRHELGEIGRALDRLAGRAQREAPAVALECSSLALRFRRACSDLA